MLASHALIHKLAALELPVDEQIHSFLNGETNGQMLFEALYGAPIDEPVPERLTALVRNAR